MLKKILLTSMLSAFGAPSLASDYYLVLPVKGKVVSAAAIRVGLAAGSLPGAQVGQAFSYDFSQHLQVTGDPTYSGYGVTWALEQGSLPAGLALDSKTGVLSGVPSAGGASSFSLTASYKTKSGQRAYQLGVIHVQVALADGTPPAGTVGQAYSFDIRPLLAVQGDAAYDLANVQWSAQSVLPAGLTLAAGIVSGTPTAAGANSVAITARYKNVAATKTYSFSVQSGKNLAMVNNSRRWADGALASSCNEYRNPTDGHLYEGPTGDGIYRIVPPGGGALDVYCDMTSHGGGWTLVRHVGPNSGGWHPVNDNAAGTQAYGAYEANPRAAGTFSIAYASMTYTQMRFASGDGMKWVRAPKTSPALATGTCATPVPTLGTHLLDSPHNIAWCLRNGSTPEDPWISPQHHGFNGATGQVDNDDVSMVYGENGVNLWGAWRTKRGGANVFVR